MLYIAYTTEESVETTTYRYHLLDLNQAPFSGRSFRVSINGHSSEPKLLDCRVPQWSVLGPLVFTVHTLHAISHNLDEPCMVLTIASLRMTSPGGGVALAILCVLGMCRPQGYVFHNFCLGRALFSAQRSGQGTFFTISVWEGCCFQAQQCGKGYALILVWYWNSGKRCMFTFFFFWEGWTLFVWKSKGMSPWAAHPYP